MHSRRVNDVELLAIQLRNTCVSDDDLAGLSALEEEVDVVGLEGTAISDEGLVHLFILPRLENIDLTNTSITDRGLRILARIESLKFLHVQRTFVTEEGVREFCGFLPECEVVWDV